MQPKLKKKFFVYIFLFIATITFGQNNKISIKAKLDTNSNELEISQTIVFFNNSDKALDTIFLHNWMNSFKDNSTPLSKRLLEDYDKSLYFSNEKHRGHTSINSIFIGYNSVNWIEIENAQDIIAVPLQTSLTSSESITLKIDYRVKIPLDKYTRYGRYKNGNYNLRYWYLAPALFDQEWKLMSHLNMDDLLVDLTDYDIQFSIPKDYDLKSSLIASVSKNDSLKTYQLKGNNRTEIEVNISFQSDFTTYNTKNIIIESNLGSEKLDYNIRTSVLNRELDFMKEHLGAYPHKKLFINKIDYSKNQVYGFNQLPKFLQPFTDVFEWDIKMFKVLSKKYIENSLLINRREDYWLFDGIQNFLMMQYVSEYYPEVKAIGNASNIWGLRSFNLAKLNFNDKYSFVNQFAMRKNVDQPLTMRADSLSNFNRKINNKYKAGLGLRYLDEYLEGDIISNKIKEYYANNVLKLSHSNLFKESVLKDSQKDISWFFGDYIQSKKKIDYTLKKVKKNGDSIHVVIKNKRNITTPVSLYAIDKNDKIIHQKWVSGIDSTTTVTISKKDIERLSLNYNFSYPELNLRDNWKSVKPSLFNKPLQFKLMKDVENPYYHQIFYTPQVKYNYYDGVQLGMYFSNRAFLNKNFTYKVTPLYATKSKKITGSFSMLYQYTFEETAIDKFSFGLSGSHFNYDKDLVYRKISPYAVLNFKRKSLRDVGGSALVLSMTSVDREVDPNDLNPNSEANKYNVVRLRYLYSKPEIIQDFSYATNLEFESDFTKLSLDLRYRRLTDSNRQFDFRVFAGAFLNNKTTSDFFSYGLSKQSDYLFRLNYFGRSEDTGFFSQQYITNEGGFKSHLEQNFANQWMTTFNSSVGLWRWIEVYNDVGFMKNKNSPVFFAYENGIRLNFIQNILEVYFPAYSNNGWEISQVNYASKIRFVLTINPSKIINFVKRGFY